jgi:hypothetical protein
LKSKHRQKRKNQMTIGSNSFKNFNVMSVSHEISNKKPVTFWKVIWKKFKFLENNDYYIFLNLHFDFFRNRDYEHKEPPWYWVGFGAIFNTFATLEIHSKISCQSSLHIIYYRIHLCGRIILMIYALNDFPFFGPIFFHHQWSCFIAILQSNKVLFS